MADEQAVKEKQDEQTQGDEKDSKTQAQTAEFSETAETEPSDATTSVDILLDMSIPVTTVIGKADVSIQRLLQLSPGSVLKLDKPIETPADLYLRDTKFATGTVVVVGDEFAVRIKEIIGVEEDAS